MPKRSTYDPDSWSNIAKNKGFSILNLDDIDPDDFKATDKLQLQCIECKSIVQPTISEMVKSRYVSKKCRCQVWKTKQEAIFEDTADWKVINRLDNFFAKRHSLQQFQSYYLISRNGEIKNASLNSAGTILDQPSLSDETYARVNLRTIDNRYKSIGISILVACAFAPVPDMSSEELQTLTVDHIDGDTKNNHHDNLRWATPSQQALNRKSMRKSGKLWIQNNSIYFNEDDFKLYGNSQSEVTIKQYDHFHERIQIEDEIPLPNEIWKRVQINGNKYLVSSMGRGYYDAWSKASWGSMEPEGYMIFQDHRIHRLVARAFLSDTSTLSDEQFNQLDIHHINDRKCDNRAENLRLETSSGNTFESVNSMIKAIKASSKSVKPKGTPIPVHQLDAKENIIQSFPSITQASETSGTSERYIRKCLRHYNKTGEFLFFDGNTWNRALELPITLAADSLDAPELNTVISGYCNLGIIHIGESDFQNLKNQPSACSSIMNLLEQFKEPILPVITDDQCTSGWNSLVKHDTEIVDDSIQASNRARKTLNRFMYQVMIKGHTKGNPTYIECWKDQRLQEKLVRRMLKYDKSMGNGSLYGCYGCLYGRLYNFPPNVAKALYNHVNAKRVLDFCSGFGGRLLGFWASNAEEYIGIDPNTDIPYHELINFLQPLKSKSARIIPVCAEDVDYKELGIFDTIFTSPPYFNTEIYSDQPTQSSTRYPTLQSWLERFLFTTLDKVIQVLAPNGTLMINIKDSKKHAIVEPMLSYLRKIPTLTEGTHIKLLQAKRHRNNTRYEYIYIWKRIT
jgi:hypothetical protein